MRPLIIIVGPTAVGKSSLGLELAQALHGEIISGDSIQVYRRLNIGSAKTLIDERSKIPHYLIDFLDPAEPYTVAQFQESALALIQEIRERGNIPIIVGGTGLYVRSILDPYSFSECGSDELRLKWQKYLSVYGKEALHQALYSRDPVSAQHIHLNNTVRVIRALEVYELTEKPFSSFREFKDNEYKPLDPFTVYIGLTAPRDIIYKKINERCHEMLKEGLLEETLSILNDGYSSKLKSLQSIGYRHVIWLLKGLLTKEEMLRLMQRDTRHFAKRQLTWFGRDPRITWYDISKMSRMEILADVINTCRGKESRVE